MPDVAGRVGDRGNAYVFDGCSQRRATFGVAGALEEGRGEPVGEDAGGSLKHEMAAPLQQRRKIVEALAGFERRQQAFGDEARDHGRQGGAPDELCEP